MEHPRCIFRFADIEVDENNFSVTKAGESLPVEPKVFKVLQFLVHHRGRVVTKDELLDAVWSGATVSESSLTRSVATLRRLLGDEIREPRFIETVATVGYRFVCPVEVSENGRFGGKPTDIRSDAEDEAVEARPRNLRRWWWMGSAAVLAIGLVFMIIGAPRRSLPPPRISGFTQITHDGHDKDLLGTDGSRLYIVQASPVSIGQVGIAGGQIAPIAIPLPGVFSFTDVSPDGANLLFGSQGRHHTELTLWNFGIPGGPLRKLRSDDAFDAAFSSDGKSVIYSTVSGDIYTAQSDGTGTRKLASVGLPAADFSHSKAEDMIRFDQDNKIWQISSDGSDLHQLRPESQGLGVVCCGHWTPDGKFFLFLAGVSFTRGGGQIWTLDERHGRDRKPSPEPIQLTFGPLTWRRVIPGKDGKTIFADGTTMRGELSRFDLHAKEFRPFLGGISAQGISFSKDGKSIAYVSFPEGILWKANRDGSNPMQLSEPPMDVFMPRWSPDGTQILFSDISSYSSEIEMYVVSAQGGNPHKLLPERSGIQSDADWSPDGRKVVFATSFGVDDPKGTIRIFDLDKQKTSTVPGSLGMADPRWSPDGRFISTSSFNYRTVNIFDVKTQRWTAYPLKTGLTFPEWSRNSQFIYFLSVSPGDPGLFRIRVDTGQIEKIVGLKDWHISGWFNQWAGLDPTDAPLLLRDIGSSDIYALNLDQ